MLRLKLHHMASAIALLACIPLVHAQYTWIDANGRRHYADQPPPPGTPHRLLKAPPAPAGTGGAKPAPSLADREAAYQERVKGRTAQEDKDAQENARRRALAEHCDTARATQAQLASGMRIAQVGPSGERSYMTDEEKLVRAAQARRALKDCP